MTILKGFDNYALDTKVRNVFFEELKRTRDGRELIEVKGKDIVFVHQKAAMQKHGDNLATIAKTTQEMIDNNLSDLLIFNNETKEVYMVGDTCDLSVSNQIKIFGSGYDELPPAVKVLVNNTRFTQLNEKEFKMVFIDGKCRAIMTSGESGKTFTHICPLEIFETFEEQMTKKKVSYKFNKGNFSYKVIKGVYNITDKSMCNLYEKYNYTPQIMICTSETGHSSTKFFPMFTRGAHSVVLEHEALVYEHKGNNNIGRLETDLPLLFVRQQNFVDTVEKFIATPVKFPMDTIKEVAKQIKAPQKISVALIEQFPEYIIANNLSSVNFYDIFNMFFEISPDEVGNKNEYELMVGRILNLDVARTLKGVDKEVEKVRAKQAEAEAKRIAKENEKEAKKAEKDKLKLQKAAEKAANKKRQKRTSTQTPAVKVAS